MTLPGKMKLSTGVMVLYADEESFTLRLRRATCSRAGSRSARTERDGETVAQAQC
jgi:hypothetical protein